MEKLTSDSTLWANSLMKTAKLFGFDGVVSGLDFSLMAEACGSGLTWENDRAVVTPLKSGLSEFPEKTGRMQHALEAARRLFEVCRSDMACVAALTGPVTLANQLFGQKNGPDRMAEVKPLVVRMAEEFCKTGPDLLCFLEGRPLGQSEIALPHRKIYNTIKNITGYYNIPVSLYLQGYDHLNLNQFAALHMDVYILGPAADNHLPPLEELWQLGNDALGLGLGLDPHDLEKADEIMQAAMQHCRSKTGPGFFFTSLGPVSRDVDLENLHQLVNEITQL